MSEHRDTSSGLSVTFLAFAGCAAAAAALLGAGLSLIWAALSRPGPGEALALVWGLGLAGAALGILTVSVLALWGER